MLKAFGRAYEALPVNPSDVSDEEQQFIREAVEGLAEDGKVIPVRLSLFAEMVKDKEWTSGTLKNVGGTRGVGATFLEETFSAASAPPEYRLHQRAARAVLRALLPAPGTDIKGHMKSTEELLEVSGYSQRPEEFEDLIRILDAQLRLLTPVDPDGMNQLGMDSSSEHLLGEARCFQLAHDYLVPSLREWLTRKQRETARGRAEIRLAERSDLWNAKPENKQLPSMLETIRIRWLTRHGQWTENQAKMMSLATRVHGVRAAIASVGLMGLLVVAFYTSDHLASRAARRETDGLIERLLVVESDRILQELETAVPDDTHWLRRLREIADEESRPISEQVRALAALLKNDEKVAPSLAALLDRVSSGSTRFWWNCFARSANRQLKSSSKD